MLAMCIYYYATNMVRARQRCAGRRGQAADSWRLQVSVARYRYKVPAPATVGVSADFDRYFRVQSNFVEGLVLFLPTLWLSAALVSPSAAAAGGAVWCLGRVLYGQGYYAAANQRGKGFAFVALAQAYLLVLAGIGAVRTFLGRFGRFPFPIALDRGDARALLGVEGVPRFMWVDGAGVVVRSGSGFDGQRLPIE
jgi:hypothetical protein